MSWERSIVWRRLDAIGAGHEFARVWAKNSKRFLAGTAIFVNEEAFCKLDYQIECNANWRTIRTTVSGFVGDKKVNVEISVDAEKYWTMNGELVHEVEGCEDIDLNFSPATNTLPIRRLNLEIGEKKKVSAAWLRFPSFKLGPLEQYYERIGENEYVYESLNDSFRAEIETDRFGLITRYGDFWKVEKR